METPDNRQTWTSRYAYWMAAVGSAVGLGNIWRFPWQVNKHGGGSFIIAYFVVLFLVGMPMLTQEMALGQKFRGGDIEAYGRMNRRLRGIGLASVLGAMLLVSYYSVIIGWSVRYFVASFESPLPWEYDGSYGSYEECYDKVANVARVGKPMVINDCLGSAGKFFDDITKASPDIESGDGTFAWELFACVIFVWVCIYISICKGVKTVGIVVWITMPLPVLFLIIMLIKGLTLDGATQGIKDLWDTDLSALEGSDIWLQAIAQCFFSLSVCMGIMTAYSSYTNSGSVAKDEKVVAFWDVGIAILSCFVIYSTIGFMNKRAEDMAPPVLCLEYDADGTCLTHEGPPTWETYSGAAGPALVFIAFPVALATFKASGFFSAMFFFTLFTLGIDSAFSMIEATSTVVSDSDFARSKGWSRPCISAVLCLTAFAISSLFCFDVGSHHIDIVDTYVITRGMTFIGIMETFSLGWVYRVEDQYRAVGKTAVNIWNYGYWLTLIFGTLVALICARRREWVDSTGTQFDYGDWLGPDAFFLGLGIVVVGWFFFGIVSYCKAKAFLSQKQQSDATFWDTVWALFGWYGAEDIRRYVNSAGGENKWTPDKGGECKAMNPCNCTKLDKSWGWLIKYFIPGLLTVLLMDQLRKDIYRDSLTFPWKYQLEGLIPLSLIILIVVVVAIFPGIMEQKWDEHGGQWKSEASTGSGGTEMAKTGTGRIGETL